VSCVSVSGHRGKDSAEVDAKIDVRIWISDIVIIQNEEKRRQSMLVS